MDTRSEHKKCSGQEWNEDDGEEERTMKAEKWKTGKKIEAILIFLTVILLGSVLGGLLNSNQKKEEQLRAGYTAESAIAQIESQLNRYLTQSELIKRIVETGHEVTDEEFSKLSSLMADTDGVVEAYEIAKDGIVTQAFPYLKNEEAVGINMLIHPERKEEANRAKETGEYTIAGPFELVQGGTGMLLFDPIYTSSTEGEEQFWGFSVLVLNWEKFLNEVELNKLESAGYQYKIWKKDDETVEGTLVLAESTESVPEDCLEVACEVPNDTWYVDIAPKQGWMSIEQTIAIVSLTVLLGVMTMAGYWQLQVHRRRDELHAEELERSAAEARAANEAKTRFLFNMSHDIRTPMNAIIGFSNLLEEHLDDREKVKDYLEKIKSSSSFLLSLINHVLEMARIENGKAILRRDISSADQLMESLNAVFEPTIQEKHLNYRCICEAENKYVIGDETKVREIFLNLVSNAVKYTPDGGSVSVEIQELPAEQEKLVRYQIVVADTGIGMSEEYLPHVFEEFSREHTSTESKVAGAGLGLHIVKSLVELMDGTISVESKVGEGTKFTVVLSFETATEEQIRETEEKDRKKLSENLQGKRILLAEDNALNAEIAMTILQEAGFIVELAENGEECIQMLEAQPVGYYDLILMDIQMPKMNGYEATEQIRKRTDGRENIPIVAMTANAFEEDRKKAFAVDMNGHIAKPIDMTALFAELERIFA